MLGCASVPSVHEIARDINAQHIRTKFCLRQSRRPIATADIQHLESFGDSESLNERLPAFAHRVGNTRKTAFFPKRSVRSSRRIHHVSYPLACVVASIL